MFPTNYHSFFSKTDSTGTDLALLTQCDHVIASHGTFSTWATLLANKDKTHIMPHNLNKTENSHANFKDFLDIVALERAQFENIIFMDDS